MDEPVSELPVLTPVEARILGCLMEKEMATPEIYPLSLNSLVNACNQKNNRSPVMEMDEGAVELGLSGLRERRLVSLFAGADARVPKYRQTLDTQHPLESPERAWLAELLLRGPQTTAGLRGNAERMTRSPDLSEMEGRLAVMAERGLVRKLPRQPGQKEARWVQLMTGELEVASGEETSPARKVVQVSTATGELLQRIEQLTVRLEAVEVELARLRAALGE
jgi:uncharacterized protein